MVPVQGSETPLTLANSQEASSTPYVKQKLSRAKAEDVQEVALRMYKVLKEHGLAAEAQRAFELPGHGDEDDDEKLRAAPTTV